MGVASGDDDRRQPPGSDGPGGPRVPAPWGEVVIPDDASELDAEATQVRQELRRERSHRRWRQLTGMTDAAGRPSATGPSLIIVAAMLVTLVSLFGGFWQSPNGDGQTTARGIGHKLPRVTLTADDGTPERMWRVRSAVVLIVGGCACRELIRETASLARRQQVRLLVVGDLAPATLPATAQAGGDSAVRALADPEGRLRRAVTANQTAGPETAVAVLVGADGKVRQVFGDVRSAEEFAAGTRLLH